MCNTGERGYVHPTNKQTILLDPCGFEFRADNANDVDPSRLKGMVSFSRSVNARRKWIVTSELVSHLIESQD